MKNSIFVLLIMITSAISLDVAAADNNDEQLNPMVLIELNASIKSDWILAGKLIVLDIEDDLINQKHFPKIANEFVRTVNTTSQNLFAVNGDFFTVKIAE